MQLITTREELRDLADRLRVRDDWHEPDEQDVTARVDGKSFDNAGFWPAAPDEILEMHVIISQNGEDVACVNLATLFAMATGFGGIRRNLRKETGMLKIWLVEYSYGGDSTIHEGAYVDREDAFKAYSACVSEILSKHGLRVTAEDQGGEQSVTGTYGERIVMSSMDVKEKGEK